MSLEFFGNGRRFRTQAFLFDKDGTLISFDHWLQVMAERARRLSSALSLSSSQSAALASFMGVRKEKSGDWGIIPLPRSEAEEATALFLSRAVKGDFPEILSLVKRIFAEVDRDFPFERHLRPTPGAEELLRRIKEAGGKVGVVTHDLAAAARLHLMALGWEKWIDAVVGLDLCPVRKPAPDPILQACALVGVKPEASVMVGDTPSDLQAGRAAGCQAVIGVLTGLGRAEELGPWGDLVLPDLSGIQLA